MRRARKAKLLTFDGQSLSIKAWARIYGIPRYRIYNRLRGGWPMRDILLCDYDARLGVRRNR